MMDISGSKFELKKGGSHSITMIHTPYGKYLFFSATVGPAVSVII